MPSQDMADDERREREEMFVIAPAILAGGPMPRRADGSRYQLDANTGSAPASDVEGSAGR